jgi:hypothetical protein
MEGIEVGCGLAYQAAASGAGEWGPAQTVRPCGEGKDATWCQYTVTTEGSGWVPYQFAWAGYSLAAYRQLYNQVQTIRALLNSGQPGLIAGLLPAIGTPGTEHGFTPNTSNPKSPAACSAYGSSYGYRFFCGVVYGDNPTDNCVRGCLLNQWNPATASYTPNVSDAHLGCFKACGMSPLDPGYIFFTPITGDYPFFIGP